MSYVVDFTDIKVDGLEASPVASTLAGLRAHEARYFMTKYKQPFITERVDSVDGAAYLAFVERVLQEERGITIEAKALETSQLLVDGIQFTYVFYDSGLAINVMYTLNDPKKRAVGFKLSEGMDEPTELLAKKFKFARQKSKLAGTIRGTFFVIKKEWH